MIVCECQDDSWAVDKQIVTQAGAVGKWTRHLDTYILISALDPPHPLQTHAHQLSLFLFISRAYARSLSLSHSIPRALSLSFAQKKYVKEDTYIYNICLSSGLDTYKYNTWKKYVREDTYIYNICLSSGLDTYKYNTWKKYVKEDTYIYNICLSSGLDTYKYNTW